MTFLLDTDWAVWLLRGRPEFTTDFQKVLPEGVALSAVTLAELMTGVYRTRDPQKARDGLHRFLKRVAVLPFTKEIAERFGEENARLLTGGQAISQFDMAIAATALQHELVLFTENRKHYERVPGLKLRSMGGRQKP